MSAIHKKYYIGLHSAPSGKQELFHWLLFAEFKSRPARAKLYFRSCIQYGGDTLHTYVIGWILIKDRDGIYLMNCRYLPLIWRNRQALGLSHCKATV